MDENITNQLVKAIAEAEGTEPEHLDITLHHYVSADAIRQLVAHDSDAWRLQFETQNHIVQVMGNNTILVDGEKQRSLT